MTGTSMAVTVTMPVRVPEGGGVYSDVSKNE